MSSREKQLFSKMKVKDKIPFLYEDLNKILKRLDEFDIQYKKDMELANKRLKNLEDWIGNRGTKLEALVAMVLTELKNAGKLPDRIAELKVTGHDSYEEPEEKKEEVTEFIVSDP